MILNNSARGLLLENNKVLFAEYHIEGETFFALPGGTIEAGENLEECVTREFLEETRINVNVESLILLNEFITPNPKAVAEKWKKGIHQIEAIFKVKRNMNEGLVQADEKLDTGMKGLKWLDQSELKNVTYYPEMPVSWFYSEHDEAQNIYLTKRY